MSKPFVPVAAPLLGVAFLLSGVVALGHQARNHLRGHDSYRIAFDAIDCPAPDGLTRAEFLGEVQYMASWPDDVGLLEDDLPARLQKTFAAHPWVEEVRRVEVVADRRVRIGLAFRTPVLSVATRNKGNSPDSGLVYRGVDANGVLLPRAAADATFLPRLLVDLPGLSCRAGTVWEDAHIQTAVRTAVFLRPFHEQLGIEHFEFTGDDLVVLARRGRVVWGKAPGDEQDDEASADVKLQRLLESPKNEPNVLPVPASETRVVKSR
jgi:hypothetical protein